jgi:hypothetical protein
MSKNLRIQTVLEILRRWGKLDKKALDESVSSKLAVEITPAFQRALYRDLEYLVNTNQIVVEYFTRDGALLSEYDSEQDKNVVCKWSIFGSQNKVSGQTLLSEINCKFFCPSIVVNEIQIIENPTDLGYKALNLFFYISGKFYSLRVNYDCVPVNLLFARNNSDISKNEVKFINQKFGNRTAIFKIPSAKSTAIDLDKAKYGHLLLKINDDKIEIEDLQSTNGTRYCKVSTEFADYLRHHASQLGKSTISSFWTDLIGVEKILFERLQGTKTYTASLPCLIDLADDFLVLLI